MEEKGDHPELAGTPKGRDGVDSEETGRSRDTGDCAEGVHAVAQSLQRPLHACGAPSKCAIAAANEVLVTPITCDTISRRCEFTPSIAISASC